MAYFNHAFCKSFLASSLVANGTNTSAFTAGEFGAVEGPYDWLSIAPAALTANNLLFLVQGSFHTQDQIGNNPGHGGYSESIKSKGINPRYVTRLYSSSCQTAVAATTEICVASDCAPCGENLFVRLDVKGSPALRFLNHNAYAIGDSSGDAAANGGPLPGLCCADNQEFLDPAMALAGAMQMVLADPIIAPFVAESGAGMAVTKDAASPQTDFDGAATLGAVAVGGSGYVTATNVPTTGGTGTGLTLDITVVAGAVTAVAINNPGNGYTAADVILITGGDGLAQTTVATIDADAGSFTFSQILNGPYVPSVDPVADVVTACASVVGAYVDTQFGNCSFDTRDHYEMEPVQIIGSVLDETGNPCNDCGVVTNTEGIMEQMSGETVLRQLLLTEAYLQNPYNQGNKDSARIREIELSNDITNAVTRADLYKTYYLQHSIPRMNNPSGVFDNDQYVYQVFVECADEALITAMDTLWGGIATLCGTYGNPIAYESDADIIV